MKLIEKNDAGNIDFVKEREAFIRWFDRQPGPKDRYQLLSAWLTRAELHYLSRDNQLPENFAALIDALNALPESGIKLN